MGYAVMVIMIVIWIVMMVLLLLNATCHALRWQPSTHQHSEHSESLDVEHCCALLQ